MFVMQPHVIGKQIQGSVVGERFRDRNVVGGIFGGGRKSLEDIVLGDEVPRARM